VQYEESGEYSYREEFVATEGVLQDEDDEGDASLEERNPCLSIYSSQQSRAGASRSRLDFIFDTQNSNRKA